MAPSGEAITDRRERLDVLRRLAGQYPDGLREDQQRDVERIAFHLERVFRPGARVADLGGGIGLSSLACAVLGLEVWLIDDFADQVNRRFTLEAIDLHRRLGVHVLKIDVGDWGRHFADGSHPGRFDDMYRREHFRGVRCPPGVADLRRIAADVGLTNVRFLGRNWATRATGLSRILHGAIDRLLRPFPTLCTHIYVEGRLPDSPPAPRPAASRNARAAATASRAASDDEM